MNNRFLPVGSVVLLEGGTKELMITGFCPIVEENKVFDYCGCLYPEGIISSDQNCVFNNNQIKEILYLGFISDKEKEFKNKLINMLDESNKNQNLQGNTLETLAEQ